MPKWTQFSNSAWRELSNDTPLGTFLIFGLNHLGDLGADDVDLDDIEIGEVVEVVEVVEAVI